VWDRFPGRNRNPPEVRVMRFPARVIILVRSEWIWLLIRTTVMVIFMIKDPGKLSDRAESNTLCSRKRLCSILKGRECPARGIFENVSGIQRGTCEPRVSINTPKRSQNDAQCIGCCWLPERETTVTKPVKRLISRSQTVSTVLVGRDHWCPGRDLVIA